MSRPAAFALMLAVACGGAQKPEPPPPYDPVNSPEAETSCPDEHKAAKEAREALLGADTPEARARAAAAVFAHAECEHRLFVEWPLYGATETDLIENIKAARIQYQNARNLYEEVERYGIVRWSIGAQARTGDLHMAFGKKLRTTPPPSQMRQPMQRAAFLDEMSEVARTFDMEATLSYNAAADAASAVVPLVTRDAEVAAWTRASCRALRELDPAAARQKSVCTH